MMLAPIARTSSGCSVFTVAFVPTGMNAGVGMSPCAVWTVPARAAPSVASRVKQVIRNSVGARLQPSFDTLQNQHRIAEGVEPVLLLDRDPVEVANRIDAGECHHEREQRRARQMEVGQQRVDAL